MNFQIVPKLSFAVFKMTIGDHLGFLGQGDLKTKN